MNKDTLIYGSLGLAATILLVVIIKNANKSTKFLAPVNGKLTSGFGLRVDPVTGVPASSHNGQDIAVPVGTPVKAPLNGTVVSTASSVDGGNQVILLHQDKGKYQNYKTGYAHLSKVLVKTGDKVKQGQVIALSGNTGKSTGPHLHLTITDDKGNKLDPKPIAYKA